MQPSDLLHKDQWWEESLKGTHQQESMHCRTQSDLQLHSPHRMVTVEWQTPNLLAQISPNLVWRSVDEYRAGRKDKTLALVEIGDKIPNPPGQDEQYVAALRSYHQLLDNFERYRDGAVNRAGAGLPGLLTVPRADEPTSPKLPGIDTGPQTSTPTTIRGRGESTSTCVHGWTQTESCKSTCCQRHSDKPKLLLRISQRTPSLLSRLSSTRSTAPNFLTVNGTTSSPDGQLTLTKCSHPF